MAMNVETADLGTLLTELKQENPQGYGYLAGYWDDAREGLENTDRNYARVRHIYENIRDPQIGTRGLGQTLVLLADLDVLSILTNRNNATIYDLTTYDAARLRAIGRLLDAQ
ncbi:hypothetical protein ACFQE8_22650 [Salinirubellus sp. GCM10025818]|uniref:hypothetical protein n=1 Tax=Salinirubellus TaxID=2162630 RepID=UPI0030D36C7A